MEMIRGLEINTPIGKQKVDSTGSPVGAVRMDADKSYTGTGELLQKYINHSDQGAWEKIKAKIDYTYESLDLALGQLEKVTNLSQGKPKQGYKNSQGMWC